MSSLPPATFASLLRRYRLAAGLTQEELAERANLSPEAIGTLERGTRRAPRKETVDMLAEALSLTEPERAAFEAAARQQRITNPPAQAPFGPTAAQTTPLEPPSLPEDGPAFSSGPLTPLESAESAQPSSSHLRRKLIAALVLLLLLGTGLLAGIHAFSGGGTLCLATDLPTGSPDVDARSLEDAVNLAVMQNQRLEHNFTLKAINYDDVSQQTQEADPQVGAYNVQQMVQNPCVVGMVGPFDSNVAVKELPIAANAGLVMISPTTTVSGLTLRPYAAIDGWDFNQLHPPGKPFNFFRNTPNDVAQGAVAADFLYNGRGAKSVYVVTDHERFGEELAAGFTQSFQAKGGSIAGNEIIPNTTPTVLPDLAARIVDARPDAVYWAGFPDEGGLFRAQLVQRGYTGPFVGGETIAGNTDFVKTAGSSAEGALAIASGSELSNYSPEKGAQFILDFHARYPNERLEPGTAEAYDAAMVLITAIKRIIAAGQPITRAAMIEQVQHIQYTGILGSISFDASGDIAHGVFNLYRVQAGAWTFLNQLSP